MTGLVQMAGFLKVGDPTDTATVIGPVISAAQRGRIEAHIATAAEDGGEVVIGGERPADLPRGFYVAPTLITGDNSMRVAREEIFGPVITMIPFDDEEEGIAIANDTEFGLYDYVFSKDGARALRVAKHLQAGHVGINTAQRNHDAPFGGFKMSGRRARRRRLRPAGLHGAAGDHLELVGRPIRSRRSTRCQPPAARLPPSTCRVMPVMKRARSLARKRMAPAPSPRRAASGRAAGGRRAVRARRSLRQRRPGRPPTPSPRSAGRRAPWR